MTTDIKDDKDCDNCHNLVSFLPLTTPEGLNFCSECGKKYIDWLPGDYFDKIRQKAHERLMNDKEEK